MRKVSFSAWARFGLLATFGAFLSTAGSSACTLIATGESTAQCESEADCLARGPLFAGTTCGPQKVCIAVEGFCKTNQECIDRVGSESSYCRKDNGPNGNRCAPLFSRECPRILAEPGQLADDNSVVVGSIYMPSWNPILKSAEEAIELARRDFQQISGGLPALPNGKPRPIVVVACDIPLSAQETHRKATDHLVDVVGVKTIMGPLNADWVQYSLQRAVQKDVVLFTPDAPGIGQSADAAGLWFSNGVPSALAAIPKGEPLLVNLHEKIMRDAGRTEPLKLALLTTGLTTDLAATRALGETLRFNGKSPAENGTGLYREVSYGAPDNFTNGTELARAVASLQEFKPDIVVCTTAGCTVMARAIEQAGLRPRYVFSSVSSDNTLAPVFDTDPNGFRRVLGTRPGRPIADPRVSSFYSRFSLAFPDTQPSSLATATYDMYYYMMFGLAALNETPASGRAISDKVLSSFKETGIKAGTTPDQIATVFDAVRSGREVNLDGTMTVGTFKPDGSLTVLEQTIWCIEPDKTKFDRIKDAGLTYRSDNQGVLQGTLTCF